MGRILDRAFTIYRGHLGAFATIVLACAAVPFALSINALGAGVDEPDLWVAAFAFALLILLSSIATAALIIVASEAYGGRTISAGDAFRRALPLLQPVLLCSFLLGLVVLCGTLMLIVPGLVLGAGLILALPALVLEPGLTPVTALSRSWALARGAKWRLFWLVVIALVLVALPAVAAERLILYTAGTANAVRPLLASVISTLVQMFLYPVFYAALTVAYYDLRAEREGFQWEGSAQGPSSRNG